MSEVKLLINLKPKNADTPEYLEMLKEFDAESDKFSGIITIPKNFTYITEDGHLLFIRPERIDYAVAFEPEEYVILAEQ